MRRRNTRRTDRAGYMLVLFVMLLFVLMGFAALVIDLGFTRLARTRCRRPSIMRPWKACDGETHRTSIPAGSARQQASSDVANLFDDDMNPADGDPMNFGAWPGPATSRGKCGGSLRLAADRRSGDARL